MTTRPFCKACTIAHTSAKFAHSDAGLKLYCNHINVQKFFSKYPCPCSSCLIKTVCLDPCEPYILHRTKHGEKIRILVLFVRE